MAYRNLGIPSSYLKKCNLCFSGHVQQTVHKRPPKPDHRDQKTRRSYRDRSAGVMSYTLLFVCYPRTLCPIPASIDLSSREVAKSSSRGFVAIWHKVIAGDLIEYHWLSRKIVTCSQKANFCVAVYPGPYGCPDGSSQSGMEVGDEA